MTRINCVPVSSLTDKHLVAEYREMLRLRHAKSPSPGCIPATYRMGAGHVKFFYNKGLFLLKRHSELREEMRRRGFKVNFELDLSQWEQWQMNDWIPNDADIKINKERIEERLKGK